MKNMKVSLKLIIGFLIVTAFVVIVGVVGIIGMNQITTALENMYYNQTATIPTLAKAQEYQQRIRVQVRMVVLNSGDLEAINAVEVDLMDRFEQFEGYYKEYDATIVRPAARVLSDEAWDLYMNSFKP